MSLNNSHFTLDSKAVHLSTQVPYLEEEPDTTSSILKPCKTFPRSLGSFASLDLHSDSRATRNARLGGTKAKANPESDRFEVDKVLEYAVIGHRPLYHVQ